MAHIPYENSQLFYDEQRARGKVTEFLPRFKMIASLGAMDEGGKKAGQGRSKTGAASAYNILLLFFFFWMLALRISLFRVDLFKNLSLFT